MTYRENSIELATNNLSISPAENAKRNREVYLNILKEEKKTSKNKAKKRKRRFKEIIFKRDGRSSRNFSIFFK